MASQIGLATTKGQNMTTTTIAVEPRTAQASELLHARMLASMDAPQGSPEQALARGLNLIALNRHVTALRLGMDHLVYPDSGDTSDAVRNAFREVGRWLIELADQGE